MNLTQDSASRVTYVVAGDKTVQVANLIRQVGRHWGLLQWMGL